MCLCASVQEEDRGGFCLDLKALRALFIMGKCAINIPCRHYHWLGRKPLFKKLNADKDFASTDGLVPMPWDSETEEMPHQPCACRSLDLIVGANIL